MFLSIPFVSGSSPAGQFGDLGACYASCDSTYRECGVGKAMNSRAAEHGIFSPNSELGSLVLGS